MKFAVLHKKSKHVHLDQFLSENTHEAFNTKDLIAMLSFNWQTMLRLSFRIKIDF